MAHRFYDCTRWRNLRDLVLSQHPLCEYCRQNGITTEATQVDHIRPIKEGGNPTALNNLQPLCDKCHSRKTRAENEPEKAIESMLGYADGVQHEVVITKKGKYKKVNVHTSNMSNE